MKSHSNIVFIEQVVSSTLDNSSRLRLPEMLGLLVVLESLRMTLKKRLFSLFLYLYALAF